MRIPLIFIFLAFFSQAFAQKGRLFKGTINNSIKITLYLQGLNEGTNADPILGSYQYDNQKDYFLLNGYRNNAGNLILVEHSTPNFSGIFFGTFYKKVIKGKWTSDNQKKVYSFQLTEVLATKDLLSKYEKEVIDKANEFRNY